MEIFFVYGLVLLFFVLLVVFVVAVLLKHPYEEPSKAHHAPSPSSEQALSSATSEDSKIAYGILSLIFAGLLLIVVLNERKQTRVSPA